MNAIWKANLPIGLAICAMGMPLGAIGFNSAAIVLVIWAKGKRICA